jgi:hypothetical protein
MAIVPIRPQYARQTVLTAQTRFPMATLYRGLKTRPEFLHEDNIQRLTVVQNKWDRSLDPGYVDRFFHKVTGRPYISIQDAREFMRLRSIACDQSYSDNLEIAKRYAGPDGFLSSLTLPFDETIEFMSIRHLAAEDHILPGESVFFIPARRLLENIRNGHWIFTIKQLGINKPNTNTD